jgi:general secretion pathway protein D
MRIALHRAAVAVGILAAAALPPAARAQAPVRVSLSNRTVQTVVVSAPVFTNISVSTTVTVPDGGTVTLGGYSRVSESRTESGPPVLSSLPYANRAFRNTAYGRDIVTGRVTASVRVIDLREEEYRQTGFRSP